MRQFGRLFCWLLQVALLILLANTAQAKTKLIKKKTPIKKITRQAHLSNSVSAAQAKAEKEQEIIRVKLDFEADERHKAWLEGNIPETHEKKGKVAATKLKRPLKKSSIEKLRFEKASFELEDDGEDYSGLDNIHSGPDDEDIKIDFDKELREVSSLNP